MKYVQTKEQCQANIDKNGNICDGCGGELTPNETFDNARNPTYASRIVEKIISIHDKIQNNGIV